MRSVADEAREHHGRERGDGSVAPGDGTDRLPQDQVRIGDRDPVAVRDRTPRAVRSVVLGVELHHAPVPCSSRARISAVANGSTSASAIALSAPAPECAGCGSSSRSIRGPMAEEELHLVGAAQLEARSPPAAPSIAPRERPVQAAYGSPS